MGVDIQKTIEKLEESLKKVTLPFTGSENYPFYVSLDKPRPSLSKHDGKCANYWHIDDGYYMLRCVNEMPKILEYIRQLENQVKEKEYGS